MVQALGLAGYDFSPSRLGFTVHGLRDWGFIAEKLPIHRLGFGLSLQKKLHLDWRPTTHTQI